MSTIFISHASADKPFVFRLAFELLAEGVPVLARLSWEMGPGDPLIASLDTALDGSARVLVDSLSHAAATKWVQYEVDKTLEAERRLGRRLLVPLRIDDSDWSRRAQGTACTSTCAKARRSWTACTPCIDHLQSLGLSSQPSGRAVLPLVLHKRIELDTFILERILVPVDRPRLGVGRHRAPRWCTYSRARRTTRCSAACGPRISNLLVPALTRPPRD